AASPSRSMVSAVPEPPRGGGNAGSGTHDPSTPAVSLPASEASPPPVRSGPASTATVAPMLSRPASPPGADAMARESPVDPRVDVCPAGGPPGTGASGGGTVQEIRRGLEAQAHSAPNPPTLSTATGPLEAAMIADAQRAVVRVATHEGLSDQAGDNGPP